MVSTTPAEPPIHGVVPGQRAGVVSGGGDRRSHFVGADEPREIRQLGVVRREGALQVADGKVCLPDPRFGRCEHRCEVVLGSRCEAVGDDGHSPVDQDVAGSGDRERSEGLRSGGRRTGRDGRGKCGHYEWQQAAHVTTLRTEGMGRQAPAGETGPSPVRQSGASLPLRWAAAYERPVQRLASRNTWFEATGVRGANSPLQSPVTPERRSTENSMPHDQQAPHNSAPASMLRSAASASMPFLVEHEGQECVRSLITLSG